MGSYPVYVAEGANGTFSFRNATPLKTLNVATVESAIVRAIRAQRGQSATVRCPSPILQKAGLVFTCTATLSDGRLLFRVVEQNDAGGVRFQEL